MMEWVWQVGGFIERRGRYGGDDKVGMAPDGVM